MKSVNSVVVRVGDSNTAVFLYAMVWHASAVCYKDDTLYSRFINTLKCNSVKELHLKVFSAIQV